MKLKEASTSKPKLTNKKLIAFLDQFLNGLYRAGDAYGKKESDDYKNLIRWKKMAMKFKVGLRKNKDADKDDVKQATEMYKYMVQKIKELDAKYKEQDAMDKHLKKFGHSTKYIDDRQR